MAHGFSGEAKPRGKAQMTHEDKLCLSLTQQQDDQGQEKRPRSPLLEPMCSDETIV